MDGSFVTCATNCTGKIDNISLVFGGYDTEQTKMYQARMIHMQKTGVLTQIKTNRNGFARNYKLMGEQYASRVLFSTLSLKPNGPALRLEFNPAKLGPVETASVLGVVASEILEDGMMELYQRARVTRFDVAFDLLGFSLSQAHFWSDKVSSSQTFNGIGMRTQTLVFNQTKRRQVVVYDKAAEQKSKGIEPEAKTWTRVEVRKRNAGQLLSLKKTKCPFLDFHLSSRAKPQGFSNMAWVLFNTATGPMMLQALLGQLSMSERAKVKNALKKQPTECWNAAKLWKFWPQIVEESGLFSPLQTLTH